jgi:3-oxoacyl-[acyl-carrier protein] reductase
MPELQGKTAIVTGASRGIGRAIALRLAREGADIIAVATTLENAEKTAAAITGLGRKALPAAVDVSEFGEVENMVKSTLAEFGKIDILVNNAGITRDNLLIRMNQQQWDEVIEVNLKGTFNCIRAVTKPLMKQRSGKIINISSIVGVIGNPGQANYCASKAGVIGLTKSVARELAPRNIQVNVVAPGFIETDMTRDLTAEVMEKLLESIPLGRIGDAETVAGAVAFLASSDADYITGQVLQVDGGMGI